MSRRYGKLTALFEQGPRRPWIIYQPTQLEGKLESCSAIRKNNAPAGQGLKVLPPSVTPWDIRAKKKGRHSRTPAGNVLGKQPRQGKRFGERTRWAPPFGEGAERFDIIYNQRAHRQGKAAFSTWDIRVRRKWGQKRAHGCSSEGEIHRAQGRGRRPRRRSFEKTGELAQLEEDRRSDSSVKRAVWAAEQADD